MVKPNPGHEEALLFDIDIAKSTGDPGHLFKRLGYIPRLDDLEHGRDVLHVQALVVLPRNAPGATDGVFDLWERQHAVYLPPCLFARSEGGNQG